MSDQSISNHPLSAFGHNRLPHWLWRRSKRLHEAVARVRDMYLIATGRCSLHVAWQEGYHHGRAAEYHRTVVMGGR